MKLLFTIDGHYVQDNVQEDVCITMQLQAHRMHSFLRGNWETVADLCRDAFTQHL